eukprot:gene25506-31160_t
MATGLVIVVKLIFDSEAAAIIYGILVSVMGIVMHQMYSPFKSDVLDKLQMMILLHLFGTQMVVVAVALSPESRQAVGSVFIFSQCVLVIHIVVLMKHNFRPLFQMIIQQFQETKKHCEADDVSIRTCFPALYLYTYSVSDQSGNTASVELVVEIVERAEVTAGWTLLTEAASLDTTEEEAANLRDPTSAEAAAVRSALVGIGHRA